MSEVVPLHVISSSHDFTWNGLILGISRDHGMKITWNHVIFTWNQVPGISWFHVMRIFVKFRCTSQRVCPTVPGVPDQTKIFRIRTEPKRTQTGLDSDPDQDRTGTRSAPDRVPGPVLNRTVISWKRLVRFGWNFDCKAIFELHYDLKGKVKALKSGDDKILVDQNAS